MIKKSKLILATLLVLFFTFSCSSEQGIHDVEIDNGEEVKGTLNQSAQLDGVDYTFKNIDVNPSLLVLNANAVDVVSADEKSGNYKLIFKNANAEKPVVGSVLYLNLGNDVIFRTVTAVAVENEVYSLATEQASLGDMFRGGSLEVKVDAGVAEAAARARNSSPLARAYSRDKETALSFDILESIEDYKWKGMTFNPNISLKSYFNLSVKFGNKWGTLPTELTFTYELVPQMNPLMSFDQAISTTQSMDFSEYIPEILMEKLRELELDVTLPVSSLGMELPLKIGINQIYIPAEITANVANKSQFSYNLSGGMKMGVEYKGNGWTGSGKFIYENTMIGAGAVKTDINGEVASNISLIIVPSISVVNLSAFKVEGNLSFRVDAEVASSVSPTDGKAYAGSRGFLRAYGYYEVYLLGRKTFSGDILKEGQQLWSVGTFDPNITFGKAKVTKPGAFTCATRSYKYPISIPYTYPVYGKKVPTGDVTITYDLYTDNGKLLKANQSIALTPNVTDTNLDFTLCLELGADTNILNGRMRLSGFVRNIKITDRYGNAGTVADFEFGSPRNNNFWK